MHTPAEEKHDEGATSQLPAQSIPAAAPTREQIKRLEAEMRKLPQIELQTDHYFADGMYARVVARPAGTVIVGKVHRKEHFYIVTKGSVQVTSDEGVKTLTAGSVLVSKPGTKRAVVALEDSICMTVHRTDKTDLSEIEEQLIEPDQEALFDSRNKLIGSEK
ncbi:MAG: hypothetical protein ACM3WS_07640 [Bacillota bacterium]